MIMSLQLIKMSASAAWVLIATVVAIALAVDMSWTKGLMLAGFGLLPPLAILFLWNEPAQTMSESINVATVARSADPYHRRARCRIHAVCAGRHM